MPPKPVTYTNYMTAALKQAQAATAYGNIYPTEDIHLFLASNPSYPRTVEAGAELDAYIAQNNMPKNLASLQEAWDYCRISHAQVDVQRQNEAQRILEAARLKGLVERHRTEMLYSDDPFYEERLA